MFRVGFTGYDTYLAATENATLFLVEEKITNGKLQMKQSGYQPVKVEWPDSEGIADSK